MNTMNPGAAPEGDSELEVTDEVKPEALTEAFSQPAAKSRRRPPKSPARQLAELEAKALVLREKVEAHRLGLRAELVDDLYNKYSITPIRGDIDESERMANLRETLYL